MAWTWASQVQQTAGVVQSIRAAFFFSPHFEKRGTGHSEEARPASVEKSASPFREPQLDFTAARDDDKGHENTLL